MIQAEDLYKAGTLQKPHGVGGEIRLALEGSALGEETEYVFLLIDGIYVPFFLETVWSKSQGVQVLKFEGIDTEEKARGLTSLGCFLPRKSRQTDPDGAIYLEQLAGFQLFADGRKVGKITGVDTSTMNTLLLVELSESGEEPLINADGQSVSSEKPSAGEQKETILVPYHEDLVTDFRPESLEIEMSLPEGLV